MKTAKPLLVAALVFCAAAEASMMSGPAWKSVSFTTVDDQTVSLSVLHEASFDAQVSTLDLRIDTGDCRIEQTIEVAGFADLSHVGLFNDESDQDGRYYDFYVGVIEVDQHDVQHHIERHFEIRRCVLTPSHSISTDEASEEAGSR